VAQSEDHLKVFSKLYSMTGGKASIPIKIWDLHLNLPEISLTPTITDVIGHYVQKRVFHVSGDSITLTPEGINYYEQQVKFASENSSVYSIFISRIEEHRGIADKLKKLLETAFPGKVNVFVSNSIPFSEDWLKEILEGIKKCNLMIIFCTPESLKARWINFEAGAAAILDKNIGPICFGGQHVGDLPTPLSHLRPQGIDCSDAVSFQDSFQKFIEKIAGKIGVPVPEIDLANSEFYQMIANPSVFPSHGEFEDTKKTAIDRLMKFYNRVNTDWNVYRPLSPINSGTLDRLERAYEDLWNIFNSLDDTETKKIKPKLYDALNILRNVIDSGNRGHSLFTAFQSEKNRREKHDEFFSLLKDCITELKKSNISDQEKTSQ
jgi:hypothetical protein